MEVRVDDVAEQVELFRALGDPVRLTMIKMLARADEGRASHAGAPSGR